MTSPASSGEKPRVLLVSSTAGGLGHSNTYLDRLGLGLRENRFPVTVVTPADYPPDESFRRSGADFVLVGVEGMHQAASRFRRYGPAAGIVRGLVRNRISGRVLGRAVAEARPGDVVHFVDYEYGALISALRELARVGIATAVTFHPADFDGSTGGIGGIYKRSLRRALSMAMGKVSLVLTHGPWIQDRLVAQLELGRDGGSPVLASNYYPSAGYGHLAWEPSKRDRGDRIRILWFGMIRRNKRLPLALRALAALPQEFSLHVAGFPAEVPEEEIRSLVRELDLEDRVRLSLDYLSEEDADRAFADADMLLATHDTRFTSASGPVADARCYGIPVVVPDSGQIAQYVRDTDVGHVASDDSPNGLAESIRGTARRLTSGEENWRELILATGRQLAWDQFAVRHGAAYMKAVARP